MSYRKFDNESYAVIKLAILDPEHTELSTVQQGILERCISGARILDRYPILANAVKVHMAKNPGLSLAQAYKDLTISQRIFNSTAKFDYAFWQAWLLKDIVEEINQAKSKGDLKSWNAGHMALLKAIGDKPPDILDPKLVEKHQFFITINNNKQSVNVNLDKLNLIPKKAREQIVSGLYSEIDDVEAQEIMDS